MGTYELEYSQPRPASYDPNVPIFEKRPHRIEAENDAEAEHAADLFFLSSNLVRCGSVWYPRSKIALYPLAMPAPPPKPDHRHYSMVEVD